MNDRRKKSADKPPGADIPAPASELARDGPELATAEAPLPAALARASWSTDDIMTIARTLRRR